MFQGYGVFLTRSSPLGAIYVLCTLLRNPLGIGNTIKMEKVGKPYLWKIFYSVQKTMEICELTLEKNISLVMPCYIFHVVPVSPALLPLLIQF